MRPFLLLSLCLTFCSLAAEEKAKGPDTVFKITDWSYGRERKTITGSNRVTGTIKLQNISKATVSDLSIVLVYATGVGEKVAGPLTQKVPALKAGETKTLNFVAELVPVFQSYTFTINYNGGKKEEWFGNSDTAQPEPKSGPIKGDANLVILGKDATVDKTGLFTATLRVKNEGTEVAKNAKVFVTFFDLKKNKIKEWSGPLGSGSVAGGKEENINVSFNGAPRNYGGYSINLKNDEVAPEAALAGGDFSGANDVEFAHFKFDPIDSNKSGYHVEAQCRNGLKTAADHIKLSLIFYGKNRREIKRFTHEMPGTVAAGGIKEINFDIPGLPAYEEYEQAVTYNTLDKTPVKKPRENTGFKFEMKPDVEVAFGQPTENDKKEIVFEGGVRNGRSNAVKDVTIHIVLLNDKGKELTSIDKVIPETIEPGAEKSFSATAPKTPNFANFNFTFKSAPAGATVAPKKE